MEPLNLEEERDSYFRDGIRRVDYVLVITRISAHRHNKLLTNYIRNLQEAGLQFEQCYGITEPVVFVKIHIPDDTFWFMDKKFPSWRSSLAINKLHGRINIQDWQKNLVTPLTHMDPDSRDDICSRIFYIHEMCKSARFGDGDTQRGIYRLLDKKVILNAFPMHDGRIQRDLWETDELLNTRTLLAKYWASPKCFYKIQPLDMVKQYFGIEIAFYFAWTGFYIKVLTPLVIISLMMFVWSVVRFPLVSAREPSLETFCQKDYIELCGYCFEDRQECQMFKLSHFCAGIRTTMIFEYQSYIYAMIMSVWAGFVGMMWKKYEEQLRKRWNLEDVEHQMDERFLYKKKQKNRRRSSTLDIIEAYTPLPEKFLKRIVCFVFICGVLVFLCGFLYLNINVTAHIKTMFSKDQLPMEELFDAATILVQFAFVRLAFSFLTKLCMIITQYQMNKYQQEHDKMFLFMRYGCAFMNQYMMFFYFAFVKGYYYNIPRRVTDLPITYEKCQLSSCMDILLAVVNTVTMFFLLGKLIDVINRVLKRRKLEHLILPQFEKEHKMTPVSLHTLQVAFIQSMILHGFLVFFSTGNFLGAGFAIIISILGQRIEAYRLIYELQRPVPKVIYNVDPWNHILIFITVISVCINAGVAMFTSEAYDMMMYERSYRSLAGYWDYRLSKFRLRDLFGADFKSNATCFYRDQRFPPNHPLKYELTQDYWSILGEKFKGLFAFELLVIFIMVLIYNNFDNLYKLKNIKKFVNDQTFFGKQHKKMELPNKFKVSDLDDY